MARGVAQLVKCLPAMHEALSLIPGTSIKRVWWHMPLIPALGKQRQEYQRFSVFLGYLRLLSKQTNKTMEKEGLPKTPESALMAPRGHATFWVVLT